MAREWSKPENSAADQIGIKSGGGGINVALAGRKGVGNSH